MEPRQVEKVLSMDMFSEKYSSAGKQLISGYKMLIVILIR